MRRFLAVESVTDSAVLKMIEEHAAPYAGEYRFIIVDPAMAQEVVDLRTQLASESEWINSISLEIERNNIQNLRLPDGLYLAVQHGADLVGLCLSYYNLAAWGPGQYTPMVHIGMLGVLQAYGGKGLATTMINIVTDWARQKKCKTVELCVDADNPHAKKLYEKLHFKKIQTHTYYDMELRL